VWSSLVDGWQRLPGWAQALGVYAAARLLSFVVLERTAHFQVANVWTGADPSYLQFAGIWDGDWYRRIAEAGYPLPLPVDALGQPLQSEWAFYPAYPFLVRAAMSVLGTSWVATAPTVSLLLGAGAVVVVHRLFARLAGPPVALGGVLLVSVFPTAPVLQLAYTESLALLALAASLYLLVTRRYLLAIPAVALLGFSRAVALPFAVVVLVHLVSRWRQRHGDPLTGSDLTRIVVLGVASVLAGLAWPVVVGVATGDLAAYTEIQSAWRGGSTEWLVPWWAVSRYLLGPWLGPVVLLGLLAALVGWVLHPSAAVLGTELRGWCLAYLGYLLVVVDPFTSVFRFLLLMFPLGLLVAAQARSRAHLLTWAAAFISLQVVWVVWLWRFTPPSDWPP
jgi:hypothetical protein